MILGLVMALASAFRGRSWPLAMLVTFAVASITEVFMDGWLMPSTYILLLILAVTATQFRDPGRQRNAETTLPSAITSQ